MIEFYFCDPSNHKKFIKSFCKLLRNEEGANCMLHTYNINERTNVRITVTLPYTVSQN